MSKKVVLWRGIAVGAARLLSVVAPVLAADEEPPEDAATDAPVRLAEVVVTGSRIHISNLASASPIYHIDADALEFQGNTRMEDTLRIMPQVFSTQNAGISNGANGTATLNLRNLGTQRTLVLLNGRRLPVGSPTVGAGADINQISGTLIKSVEVLTGGSSATSGAEAVAGVVNFLMVDDFEGVKLDYQFSQYQHNNDSDRWQGLSGMPGIRRSPARRGTAISRMSPCSWGRTWGVAATSRSTGPIATSKRSSSGTAITARVSLMTA